MSCVCRRYAFHFACVFTAFDLRAKSRRKSFWKILGQLDVCSYIHKYYFEHGRKCSRVTSSIFAYSRRTAGLLARMVEWGHRGVRRLRVESIKTSRKQVRLDPPGKFKRTFHRVVITRIRVARALVTLAKSFPDPVWMFREGRKTFLTIVLRIYRVQRRHNYLPLTTIWSDKSVLKEKIDCCNNLDSNIWHGIFNRLQ